VIQLQKKNVILLTDTVIGNVIDSVFIQLSSMNKHITIKDLAFKLGISVSTVSRALRNAPDINTRTKQKVLKLAEELDYEPNALAKSLVQKRTNLIGIIVPELDMHFFSSIIRGAQEYAYSRGYNILIAQSDENYELEVENVKSMVSRRLDGLIISLSKNTKDFSHFDKLIRRGMPLVLFDRASDNINTSKVVTDGQECAYKATEHLINQGYSKIAHIGGPKDLYISKKRLNGYLEALRVNGLPINDDYIVKCNMTKDDAARKTRQLMSLVKPPDAFFVINDPIAIEVMKVIKEIGLKIPFHIGVIGFNDEPICDLLNPKLSSVNVPTRLMGKQAIEILIDQIEGENKRIVKETISCDVVVRESSDRRAFLRKNKIT